ncbi:MAG: tetratricopeptide repeat protein [Candidatus Peribacteraceae bacterium]|nr:tetratricopeptide repeat protein [Candidatus Peribacteraceae bacterium]
MRLPARVVAPIILALLCAGTLMGFLWWQLTQSAKVLTEGSRDTNAPVIQRTAPTEEVTLPAGNAAVAYLRQGDLLALQSRWAEAQERYELAVKEGGDLPALRKLAQAQLQRRDTEGVRSTIRQMKSAGAKPEDLLLLESIINLRTGELVKARSLLENAQDSPHQHYGLALLGIIEGAHEQVQQELKLVMNGWEPILRSNAKTLQSAYDEYALFPESPEIHLVTLLSRALAQVQECELALPLLHQVTQRQTDYRDAWIVQGYCELTTERAQQSIVSLEQAYNIDPQKPEIQYFLGRAHAAAGDSINAITFLEYAIANGFQPEAEARQELAREALKVGKGEVALAQYALLVQKEDATIEMFEGLVQTSIALGQLERAELGARGATERFPQKGRAFELLGDTLRAQKREEEAREAYQQALRLDPFLLSAKEKLANE